MTKAATVRAIYKCLLRDAKDLQRTPQFRLRNALRLEQWGTGHFVEAIAQTPTTSSSNQADPPDAKGKTKLADIRSLEQYLTLREEDFGYDAEQHADLMRIIRASFRENVDLKDPKVRSCFKYVKCAVVTLTATSVHVCCSIATYRRSASRWTKRSCTYALCACIVPFLPCDESQSLMWRCDLRLLRTLQELSEQQLLAKCSSGMCLLLSNQQLRLVALSSSLTSRGVWCIMLLLSVTTTRGIRIEATSQYVETHSNPEQNIFRFTYRITITNQSAYHALFGASSSLVLMNLFQLLLPYRRARLGADPWTPVHFREREGAAHRSTTKLAWRGGRDARAGARRGL